MSKPTRQGKCRRLSVLPFLFFICARYVFPILSGKGLGLPRFCRKAAPFGGLVGQKKIILASLRYFLLPSLAQKGNPRAGGL
ncbi:MAG: hypothetical protein E6Y51_14785 [Bacteroides sp.]|jgi:hypothetical protein|uniref:hypothetical protein n=1 Tax=Phocaeicola vulgatus TaxID=821 RepID=UPI00189C1F89|nr:hypothetical protein [Phocaeicola vulgatus]MBS5608691.1 hypothetical protein [Bacteroides sp.]MDB1092188.1 hypothetical protein [Phocaeicola vulgatus]MDU4537869.1 hypothetical protein [Bacteroides sp.]MDU4865843.1 hypothetical protein [Bacteroides sp.]